MRGLHFAAEWQLLTSAGSRPDAAGSQGDGGIPYAPAQKCQRCCENISRAEKILSGKVLDLSPHEHFQIPFCRHRSVYIYA